MNGDAQIMRKPLGLVITVLSIAGGGLILSAGVTFPGVILYTSVIGSCIGITMAVSKT